MAAKKSAAKKPATKATKPAARKSVGRPARSSTAAAHRVMIRLTDPELEALSAAAVAAGLTLSAWMRDVALSSIKKR